MNIFRTEIRIKISSTGKSLFNIIVTPQIRPIEIIKEGRPIKSIAIVTIPHSTSSFEKLYRGVAHPNKISATWNLNPAQKFQQRLASRLSTKAPAITR